MTFLNPLQKPIGSRFNAGNTASEVLAGLDLRGKTAIVTGGYSGLGLETVRVLSGAGANCWVPARSKAKARAALAGIDGVQLAAIDLLDAASIDAFARAFLDTGQALDMLVLSAGVMATPLSRDARGCESQFSSNHLGHFRLATRLWPALRRAAGARVVSVSSRGHRIAAVDFEDPNFQRRTYEPWQAYGQSKTANSLFAVALDARGKSEGVRAFALHPGSIFTDLARHLSEEDLRRRFGISHADPKGRIPAGRSVAEGGDFRTVAQGAATSVWCATAPQLDGIGGVYCENLEVAQVVEPGHPGLTGVFPWAIDPEAAERLWSLSESLSGASLAP